MHRARPEAPQEEVDEEGCMFYSLPQGKAERIAHLYALVVVHNRGKSAAEIHAGLQVLLSHTKEDHDGCPKERLLGVIIRRG